MKKTIVLCKNCMHFNYNHLIQKREIIPVHNYCGLHGSATVKPNDNGHNFAHIQNPRIKGCWCGYYPDNERIDTQLELFNN